MGSEDESRGQQEAMGSQRVGHVDNGSQWRNENKGHGVSGRVGQADSWDQWVASWRVTGSAGANGKQGCGPRGQQEPVERNDGHVVSRNQ